MNHQAAVLAEIARAEEWHLHTKAEREAQYLRDNPMAASIREAFEAKVAAERKSYEIGSEAHFRLYRARNVPRLWWLDESVPLTGWQKTSQTAGTKYGGLECDFCGHDHHGGNGEVFEMRHPTCAVTPWVCDQVVVRQDGKIVMRDGRVVLDKGCASNMGAAIQRGRDGYARRVKEHAEHEAAAKIAHEDEGEDSMRARVEHNCLHRKWFLSKKGNVYYKPGLEMTYTATGEGGALVPYKPYPLFGDWDCLGPETAIGQTKDDGRYHLTFAGVKGEEEFWNIGDFETVEELKQAALEIFKTMKVYPWSDWRPWRPYKE